MLAMQNTVEAKDILLLKIFSVDSLSLEMIFFTGNNIFHPDMGSLQFTQLNWHSTKSLLSQLSFGNNYVDRKWEKQSSENVFKIWVSP